jgi:signal transduction histidine kinase
VKKKSTTLEKGNYLRLPAGEKTVSDNIINYSQSMSGIAHDLNNILASISGYSEMLQEDLPVTSTLSVYVRKIQEAVLKARSVSNLIPEFSRQNDRKKKPVNVSEVLYETIGFIKSSLRSDIIIKSRIAKKDARVLADSTQLFRVFLNLMTNAVQSMKEKGGTLSVNLAIIEGKLHKLELQKGIVADEYVLITFKDTGYGMDPSVKNKIFEPYFTTRETENGTGLGLSVVHQIVSEMEGEILISSKKQKGSIFYIYLPVFINYSKKDC